MSKPMSQHQRQRRRSSVWGLILLLCLWSSLLGWGLTQAQHSAATDLSPVAQTTAAPSAAPVGTVDVVPPNLQFPQELYLEQCGSCHIALPPAVLPTQTWRVLLLETDHYGVTLPPFLNPQLRLTWAYIKTFARSKREDELTPFEVKRSRYFKILHPRVQFSTPVSVNTCVNCHPSAAQYNFRQLSPEWENAP